MRIAKGPNIMPRSGIREIMELAANLPDVMHLEVGEPDFETPGHIVEAAERALRAGHTRYSPSAGIFPLREALSQKLNTVNRFQTSTDNVIVCSGAVQGVFSALAATVEAGDEILVPDPGWPNYRMMATVLHATAVGYELERERGFLPAVEELEKRASRRTRVLIVNSPSNPLGTTWSAETILEVAAFAASRNLWIISDECYDQIVFDGDVTSFAASSDPERVITVFSFSKTYAMTGWRVGYLAVPAGIRETLVKLQEPLVSCANTPAQYAALAALAGPQEVVARMVSVYRERRDRVQQTFEENDVLAFNPAGAFYQWVPIRGDSGDVARRLVTTHGVAVAPGATFGNGGTQAVRVSLAASSTVLDEGLRRLLASGLVGEG